VCYKVGGEFPYVGTQMLDGFISSTGEKFHLVMYALEKSDAKYNTLVASLHKDLQNQTNNTEKLLWKWEQEAKIEGRRRSVETKPENIPEGKGNANNLENQIKKQRDKWVESGSIADHAKLKALQKQKRSS